MPQAIVKLGEREDRLLTIVRGKFGLKNKSDAVNFVIDQYGEDLLEPQLRPEYKEELLKIDKGKFKRFTSIDDLRKEGLKVGLLRPCFFRPFPKERIIKALSKVKAVAVLDRSESFSGCGGPLFNDIKSAMFESSARPYLVDYIFGLGGRDIFPQEIKDVYYDLYDIVKSGKIKSQINYLGVRE